MGSFSRLRARRALRLISTVGAFVSAATCSDQPPVAPRQVAPGMAAFSISPAFASIPNGGPVIPLSSLRAVLTAPNGDATRRDVPFVGDSAVLTFEVPIAGTAVPFTLALTAFDVQGVVAFSALQQLTLHPGDNALTQSPLLVPDGPDSKVTALHIMAASATIPALGSMNLAIAGTTLSGQAVTPLRVGWTSKDPAIATVDQTGAVKAGQSQGTTFIVARAANGVADSVALKVQAPVDHVVFTTPTLSLVRGRTAAGSAELRDVTNRLIDDRTITWSSTDPTVASVSTTGTVTALKIGTATITASSEGKSATLTVTVTTPLDHIELSPTPVQLASLKQSVPLVTKLVPVAGGSVDGITPTFSSSNPSIATVDANGIVTSVANGATKITAQVDGLTASVDAVVAQVAVSVALAPKVQSISTLTGSASVTSSALDAKSNLIDAPKITWTSSDTTIATVTGIGNAASIKARRAGSVQITATVDGKSDVSTVVIAPTIAMMVLRSSAPNIPLGQSVTLIAKYADAEGNPLADAPNVTYSTSSNFVSLDGNIATGIAAGTATFIATSGHFTASLSLPVVSLAPQMIVFGDVDMFDDYSVSSNPTYQLQFFSNIFTNNSSGPRGQQKTVAFYRGHGSLCGGGETWCGTSSQGQLRTRLGQKGLTVTDFDDSTGTIAGGIDPHINTIVLLAPTVPFSGSEIAAFKSFASEGGRIIFAGEDQTDYGSNLYVANGFLESMGVTIAINSDVQWCDVVTPLPSSSMRSDPLTAGVQTMYVGCAASLDIWGSSKALFYEQTNALPLGALGNINLSGAAPARVKTRKP